MSDRAPLFGAIADDLTGGAELASMMVARGIATGFSVGVATPLEPAKSAYVIALKTRVAPVEEAVAAYLAAAEHLIDAGCRQIFFKYCGTFDSTPKGNIGPCAEALMARLGAERVLFAPHLIEARRTIYQGYMFGANELLSEGPKRHDPLTPMTDSNLVRVLDAQSFQTAGLIAYADVVAGAQAIKARSLALAAQGKPLQIVDGIFEHDLAQIAEAVADEPLFTGNASVAAHLPPAWRRRGLAPPPVKVTLPAIEGPAAILAGSVAERTEQQLAHFGRDNPVFRFDLSRAFAGEDVSAQARAFAARWLPARPVAFATGDTPEGVAALQDRYGVAGAAAKAEALLSDLAKALVGDFGVRRLVVAGGETSGAIIDALGLTRLVVGSYLGPGLNRAVTLGEAPLALMLKSGKLGPVDIFTRTLDDMRNPDAAEPFIDHWPPSAAPRSRDD